MDQVMTMGCDTHLDSFTASVVNGIGGEETTVEFPNTAAGWRACAELAQRYHVAVVGVEGSSSYGRPLSQTLNADGLVVREIPTRLTSRVRRLDGAGKSDPGDGRAIARATARGEGNRWCDHTTLETIRVLTHRRENLVTAQTRASNELRALLVEIDPERAAKLGRLRSLRVFRELGSVQYRGDTYRETTARLIRDLAKDCRRRLGQIRQLEKEIEENMPEAGQELISRIDGCGVITAAQILAEIAGTDGFATDAKMAAWAGISPLDASSGRQEHHRLNRNGNRQANRAIHTIVTTQDRQGGAAHAYVNRRMKEDNKTKRAAIRAAKRHTIRTVWKILRDHQLT